MEKPLICFISFNRLGTAALNLKLLLEVESDFDLVIVDNASIDGIWEYILKLKDDRIKLKHRFEKNYGVVYAINYGLSKRNKYQPFIVIENDVVIDDKKWIEKLQKTSQVFPELGLIGAPSKFYLDTNKELIKEARSTSDILLANKSENKMKMTLTPEIREDIQILYRPSITGCCTYLTPQVLELIGYWNEETCGADSEIGRRINMFTPYYCAFTLEFLVDLNCRARCNKCEAIDICKYKRVESQYDCHLKYKQLQSHREYRKNQPEKINKLLEEIKSGKRSAYSASIHDFESMENNYYDMEEAMKNFMFFYEYSKNNNINFD